MPHTHYWNIPVRYRYSEQIQQEFWQCSCTRSKSTSANWLTSVHISWLLVTTPNITSYTSLSTPAYWQWHFVSYVYYSDKCTKRQFIHLLTATCNEW